MHDLRAIRDNPEAFDAGLKRRGLPPLAEEVLALDRAWREAETQLQAAQARRNQISKELAKSLKGGAALPGLALVTGSDDTSKLLAEAGNLKVIETEAAAEAVQ